MKVAVVEKVDYASGTSSRSTKLIHGGLRYLKQLELKLVHDVGVERATVYRNARHLVIPEKMLLPIVKNGSLNKFMTSIALAVYDILAGVTRAEWRRMLDKSQTLIEEPLLNSEKVIAGGLYYEYRTDDSRLVIELAKSAVKKGAVCLNYSQVTSLTYNEEKRISGARVLDIPTQKSYVIKAHKVVNAAGPFVDLLRKNDDSLYGKRLQLTKGVHLVFPHEKLPLRHSSYFDVADGRMIFAIPRNGITYVGTTDTVYNQDIDQPTTTEADVTYLLQAVNEMFPTVKLMTTDIISSWAGLRPLIHEDGKSPSELSRKDEVMESPSGMLSIAGGKLTGYRLMAKKIVDIVAKEMLAQGRHYAECKTKDYPLSGGEFASAAALKEFEMELVSSPTNSYLPTAIISSWVYRYGRNTVAILDLAAALKNKYENVDELSLAAEISYCYEHEMIHEETDFVIRRSGMLYFDKSRLDRNLAFIHHLFNTLSVRSEIESRAAKERLEKEAALVTTFK
jgi:hypothetical protein